MENTSNQVCYNNLVWKFDKTKKEPMALLRNETSIILGIGKYYIEFDHFERPIGEEIVNRANIFNHKFPLDCNVQDNFNYLNYILVNPVTKREYFYFRIYALRTDYIKETFKDPLQDENWCITPYLHNIAIAMTQKINHCILEKYESLPWYTKLSMKYFNGETRSLLCNIPLSDFISDIMKEKFYDPAKKDDAISASSISDITLVFQLRAI